MVAENFVPALETLSSLGFEERNPGCPGNFAGMSWTPGGVQKVRAKKLRAHFSFPILSRETTNSCVELLRCRAIRPEGGHAHHGDVVSKVVVVHWVKACIAVGHEVPNLIGRDAVVPKHNALLHDKILWKIRALARKPWVRLI